MLISIYLLPFSSLTAVFAVPSKLSIAYNTWLFKLLTAFTCSGNLIFIVGFWYKSLLSSLFSKTVVIFTCLFSSNEDKVLVLIVIFALLVVFFSSIFLFAFTSCFSSYFPVIVSSIDVKLFTVSLEYPVDKIPFVNSTFKVPIATGLLVSIDIFLVPSGKLYIT